LSTTSIIFFSRKIAAEAIFVPAIVHQLPFLFVTVAVMLIPVFVWVNNCDSCLIQNQQNKHSKSKEALAL
jgi:hypothetical protein